MTTDTLESSWLIQRLEKPWRMPKGNPLADNQFSFGGGYKNGGLSDEAMDFIRDIWSFGYMGAAEYEWGAVPEALSKIAKAAGRGELTALTVSVALKNVPKNWRDKSTEEPEDDATIYVLCPKTHAKEIERRIVGWATDTGPEIRDATQLPSALRPYDEWDHRDAGWLELDNGFLFFTDEEMWRKSCELFGVEIRDQ